MKTHTENNATCGGAMLENKVFLNVLNLNVYKLHNMIFVLGPV